MCVYSMYVPVSMHVQFSLRYTPFINQASARLISDGDLTGGSAEADILTC